MSPLFSAEQVNTAKKKIMSYSEYLKLGKLKFPDHFYLQGKGKEILFYQVGHSHDPASVEFLEIPQLMSEFKPDKIFVEMQGWLNAKADSPHAALRKERIATWNISDLIKEYGEPIFTIHTALAQGVSYGDVISPELSFQHLAEHLKNHRYSLDTIFLFYVIRNLGTAFYENDEVVSEDTLAKNCKQFAHILDIPQEESVGLFKKLHKEILGKDFENDTDHKTYNRMTRPLPNDDGVFGYFNKMGNIATQFRDETIIEKVANVLEQNNKLMIVYGASHGVVQKPALEYLLSE